MQFTAAIAAAILAFTSGAAAHMRMANPVPFAGDNSDPLEGNGANFPCKASGYEVKTMNSWEAGSTQTVSFIGSAVHAGGSCQFSFTTDTAPTTASVWKVIHSVIGGCPKAGAAGNLEPADPEGTGADKFAITIPKDVPNGQLTFAWTWFNKMGNREMYMQCAPVTITGGASGVDTFSALPDMFVANAPNTTCITEENFDISFPNPGASVQNLGDPSAVGMPGFHSVGGAGCPTGGSSPAPPPSGPAPGEGQQAPPSDPAPAPPADPAPAPPVAPAPAPPAGGSGCTTNGALVCFSATSFGICDNGNALPQPVAAGTTCSGGAIVRRAVHHPRRHASSMVRRHGSAFKA